VVVRGLRNEAVSSTTYAQRMEYPGILDGMERRGLASHGEQIVMHSLLDARRLMAVMDALDAIPNVLGDTAEIGCAGGGTSLLIAKLNGGRSHWACDTFDGLADCGEEDDLQNRDFRSRRCTDAIVRARLSPQENIALLHGYFPDCAPPRMRESRFAFAHIDVDTYRSIHSAFAFFAARMSSGGFIALDDVIGRGTRGGIQAWREINADARGRWEVVSETDPQVIVRFA
jgi:hypothetical protein